MDSRDSFRQRFDVQPMTLRIGVSTMLADCNIDLGHDDEKHAEESLTPNLQTSRQHLWLARCVARIEPASASNN
jgi:hypothetical protein